MFSLDLSEIEQIVNKIPFISHNRFNLFSFRDKDHLQLPGEKKSGIQHHLHSFLQQNGIDTERIKRTQLITNLCTLGYQFNPVSFYYSFDQDEKPVCAVAEVSNTFREMKLFFLGSGSLQGDEFTALETKNFYVSPFIDLDTHFDFHLVVPNERLQIRIDDYKKGNRFFTSTLEGERKELTTWNVLKYAFRFPLITLQVMTLIHWQALKLWFKKINYHKKNANPHLQLNVLK